MVSFGYHNSILRVNLTTGEIKKETISEDLFRRYIGGACMINYFLMKELKPNIDPLGPDNLLIFAPGVVTGAPVAGSGRNAVGAKSPLTNGIGKSEAGGYWGAELKKAGYDLIIISGRSNIPVYLCITDKNVEIRNAEHLWGKPTKEVHNFIREENKHYKIAQIGPAGEKLVRYAAIINDLKYAAGRTGMGAVMGSKNLRAIAVKGSEKVNVAEPALLEMKQRTLVENLKKNRPKLHLYGTGHDMDAKNAIGNAPVYNFSECHFDEAENLSAVVLKNTISSGMRTCYKCPIQCKKVVHLSDPYVDPAYGGPEYETLAAMGNNCGIGDLATVAKAHELCNAYGLDTISTGVTISFAMECFEKGIITKEDTDNLDLKFGNKEALIVLIENIANREGIGDLLAEGTKRASEILGKQAEELAVHVKGVELAMHEPRLKFGLGLGFAVASHGVDHGLGIHDTNFIKENPNMDAIKALGYHDCLPADDLSPTKISILSDFNKFRTFHDSLVTCYFIALALEKENMFSHPVDILNMTTGWNSTVFEALKIGERAITMGRLFNMREGLTAKDDCLPPKMFKKFTAGPLKGRSIDRKKFKEAISFYYKLMGWDPVTGVPLGETLECLGIDLTP